jgi:toxin ParE1/3/4
LILLLKILSDTLLITSNKIYQRAQLVAENPDVGRIVPEFNEKSIREVIEGHYRIIYRMKTAQQVAILRVYHSARLLKAKEL